MLRIDNVTLPKGVPSSLYRASQRRKHDRKGGEAGNILVIRSYIWSFKILRLLIKTYDVILLPFTVLDL